MKKIMKEKNQVVPDEVLSKVFLIQFKTEVDVSKFLKQLRPKYWNIENRTNIKFTINHYDLTISFLRKISFILRNYIVLYL